MLVISIERFEVSLTNVDATVTFEMTVTADDKHGLLFCQRTFLLDHLRVADERQEANMY